MLRRAPPPRPILPRRTFNFYSLLASLIFKNKKVTGRPYQKFYAQQLLFGTFFDIYCRSRDINEKRISEVVFFQN